MISFFGTFVPNSQVLRWCALFTVWFGVVASANAAIEIVGETSTTFAWDSPAGSIAGYYVYVSRNGASASLHSTVIDANSQTVHSSFGETIQVSTAAFDENGNTGPRSDPSEEVRFVEASATTPLPTATPFPTPTLTPTPTSTPIPTPTDANTDANTDSNIKTDSTANTDSNVDTHSNANTDSNVDTDSNANVDSNVDTDSDAKPYPGDTEPTRRRTFRI